MANFSVDQVRQYYVALSKQAGMTSNTPAGGLKVRYSDDDVWFEYVSPNGEHGQNTVVRSDLIPKKNVNYAIASKGAVRKLRKLKVSLDPSVNAGAPIAGQDYILRFIFYGLGIGGNENQYLKEGGAYRAKTGDSAATLYEKLAALAKMNFSREPYPFVTVSLDGVKAFKAMTTNSGVTVTASEAGTPGNKIKFAIASVSATNAGVTVAVDSSGNTTITASLTGANKTIADLKSLVHSSTDLVVITGTDGTILSAETTAVTLSGGTTTGLVIEEVLQPWVLGKRQASPVHFNVFAVPVVSSGVSAPWGLVVDDTANNTNEQKNGRMAADMEWFYIGDRADQYRGVGYPNNFETKYLADPSKEYKFVDIEYFYAGDSEDNHKSKKMITIALPNDGSYSAATLIIDLGTAGITVTDQTA